MISSKISRIMKFIETGWLLKTGKGLGAVEMTPGFLFKSKKKTDYNKVTHVFIYTKTH